MDGRPTELYIASNVGDIPEDLVGERLDAAQWVVGWDPPFRRHDREDRALFVVGTSHAPNLSGRDQRVDPGLWFLSGLLAGR
jgi:hypothetical protein